MELLLLMKGGTAGGLGRSWGKKGGFRDPAESLDSSGVEIPMWEPQRKELGKGSAHGSVLPCLTLPY